MARTKRLIFFRVVCQQPVGNHYTRIIDTNDPTNVAFQTCHNQVKSTEQAIIQGQIRKV